MQRSLLRGESAGSRDGEGRDRDETLEVHEWVGVAI